MNATISDSPLFPLFLALAAIAALGACVLFARRSRDAHRAVLLGTLVGWIGAVAVLGVGSGTFSGRPLYTIFIMGATLAAAIVVFVRATRRKA